MIKKGEGMYIFESDAILVKNPAPFVQQFLTSCKNPHMLLLGSFEKHMDSDSYELNKIEGQFFGLHGYYITYTGAQILLKYLFPIEYQIDSYISNLLLLHEFMEIELNIWRVNPSICYQNNLEGTTIQTKNVLCPY
jgi:GR25 family glycosyltransferase involved in LPS biosynthesis